MQSGQLRPLGYYWKSTRMHEYALKKQAKKKKKAPAIGFLVPFYVKHSKVFCQLSVTSENYIPQ